MDFIESIKAENVKTEKGLDEWYGLSCSSVGSIEKQIDELLSKDDITEEQLQQLMASVRGDVASLAARHKSLHG